MVHLISLGAGVQSSTMALMSVVGEIEPMPLAAIFADTQAEPDSVYKWLDWLEQQLPFPVYRVTAGNLTEAALASRTSRNGGTYFKTAIPFYTRGDDGKLGMASRRQCTEDFKIVPIKNFIKKLCGINRGQKTPAVTQWLGISLDEIQRMKPAREPWLKTRWPLIEKRMTRATCLEWMRERGYPEPPRSACVYCPFKSDAEWRRLKITDPKGWADAVAFDKKARELTKNTNFRSRVYVHRSGAPLDEVDLRNDTDHGQLTFWDEECSGMCGV